MPTITCIGGPFCVIADGSGFVANGDGTNWNAPVPLNPAPALATNPTNPTNPGSGHPGADEAAVSCATRKFCAIVDNSGNAYTWKDGSWLAPQAFGSGTGPSAVALYASGRVGVSCPTTSACTAVIGTAILDWNGSTWSEESLPWTPTLADPSHRASAVSGNPTAISCATSTLCAIVNGSGASYRNGAPTWSPTRTIDPSGMLDSISCPRVSFCMAADTDGFIVTWDGATWARPIKVIPVATVHTGIGTSVSCSSANFCMVINEDGAYATFSGPTDG
jgi:ferredoxin